jgi:hypothetical protein
MIHLQLIARAGDDLHSLIRQAIREERIRSFEIAKVRGGLTLRHRKHQGDIRLEKTKGPLLATLRCRDRTEEWQILVAFVGRLTYHFKNELAALNIQFEPDD